MNKNVKNTLAPKILLWVLVLLVVAQLALALGIRPAKTTIISDNTKEHVGQFWVINNDQREFTVTVSVEGEMGQYVILKTSELRFRSDDDALPVDFEVHLPETVPAGISTANIVVGEQLESESPNTISSKIVLKHKMLVQGPYPDKYINVKLNFHDQGETIAFVSEVENLGKQDITAVKTSFYVNDQKQESQVAETAATSLNKKENKLLTATLDKDLFEKGEFEVSAVTTYDDQKVELIKTLVVGSPSVDVAYFDQYFVANKINQYTLDLLNQWNRKIEHVFVDVEVTKNGQKVDQFRTKSVDLPAAMMERIQDYYDARQKNPGKYGFDLLVNFWNVARMDQKKYHYDTEFLTNEEYKSIDAAAPKVPQTQQPSSSSFMTILLWIVVGSIIGAIGLFVLWRYLHRDEYEGGEQGL